MDGNDIMKLRVGEIVTLKHYSAKRSNRGI